MNRTPCPRSWEIEAERDGRLHGKDLASALRHRETCTECALEAERSKALAARIAALPSSPLDAVSARRVRQRLMATMNDSLLEPKPVRHLWRNTGLLAAALIPILIRFYFWVGHRAQPSATSTRLNASVQVDASSGARWTERVTASLERIEFNDGSATFTVHPHPNRRVLIELPDGEIEDLGTIFQVRVEEKSTRRISVTEGRIAVRLRERAPFTLAAGETWQREEAPSSSADSSELIPPVNVTDSAVPSVVSSDSRVRAEANKRARANAVKTLPPATPAPTPDSTKAEDEAYLGIIDSLRHGRNAEARERAKTYLLHFPSGFRRIEVLNIATGTLDAGIEPPVR